MFRFQFSQMTRADRGHLENVSNVQKVWPSLAAPNCLGPDGWMVRISTCWPENRQKRITGARQG